MAERFVGSDGLLARSTGVRPCMHRRGARRPQTRRSRRASMQRHDRSRSASSHITDEIKPDSADAIAELHAMKLARCCSPATTSGGRGDRAAGRHRRRPRQRQARPERRMRSANCRIRNRESRISISGRHGRRRHQRRAGAAQADLGIAIGSGSDIAKETGDIVLVGGSLHGIATAIRLSRATMRRSARTCSSRSSTTCWRFHWRLGRAQPADRGRRDGAFGCHRASEMRCCCGGARSTESLRMASFELRPA